MMKTKNILLFEHFKCTKLSSILFPVGSNLNLLYALLLKKFRNLYTIILKYTKKAFDILRQLGLKQVLTYCIKYDLIKISSLLLIMAIEL